MEYADRTGQAVILEVEVEDATISCQLCPSFAAHRRHDSSPVAYIPSTSTGVNTGSCGLVMRGEGGWVIGVGDGCDTTKQKSCCLVDKIRPVYLEIVQVQDIHILD